MWFLETNLDKQLKFGSTCSEMYTFRTIYQLLEERQINSYFICRGVGGGGYEGPILYLDPPDEHSLCRIDRDVSDAQKSTGMR